MQYAVNIFDIFVEFIGLVNEFYYNQFMVIGSNLVFSTYSTYNFLAGQAICQQ
jgi:hypothetical protein